MKTISFPMQGVCSTLVEISCENSRIHSVRFTGGCPGSLAAIASLLQGMEIRDAIPRLKGIPCRENTSCPNELAGHLESFLAQNQDCIS